MWFVALSHRPHIPSLPLSVSLSLSRSLNVKRILPSFLRRRPSHRETQQNSLLPMTHSRTSRAPLHTTLSTATAAHLTTPRPGSKFSTACLPLCLSFYLPVSLLFLYLSPLPSCLVKMSHCLPVFTPSACLFFYQPVLWIFILSEFV